MGKLELPMGKLGKIGITNGKLEFTMGKGVIGSTLRAKAESHTKKVESHLKKVESHMKKVESHMEKGVIRFQTYSIMLEVLEMMRRRNL